MKNNKIINFEKRKKELLAKKKTASTPKPKKKISLTERNKMIVEYMPMIRCVARRISSRLPSHIDHEDLVSNGVIGLMDAIEKYDETRNNKFKTYAEFRVRGAILDSLRSQDWIPRSIRDKAKKINKAVKELELKLSRAPSEQEVAEALEISMKEYHNMVKETSKVSMVSIDETSFLNKADKASVLNIIEMKDSSFNLVNKKSIQKVIAKSIEELPERQRTVLSLYYYEEFNLRKIGQVLKVTESRVSQLHAQAIEKLKVKLSTQLKEEELKAA